MSELQQPGPGTPAQLPQRILLVDDDELELELMADRLKSLGFETHTVSDGGAALELLQTQSFPVVITDWKMPHVDGIQLTERLREQGDSDTYIIMLTVLDDSTSHERGYFAGVDDYLSKRAPDAKIVAGVRAAFKAVEMRHALRLAKSQHEAGSSQGDTGDVLVDRLRAEVKRAARYGRKLSLLVLQLESDSGAGVVDVIARAAEIAANSIRIDIDFVARYRGPDGVQRVAVILPETERETAILVGGRLCALLAQSLQTPLETFTARVGCAAFTPGQESQPAAHIVANIEGLLREAEAGARVAPLPAASSRRSEAG